MSRKKTFLNVQAQITKSPFLLDIEKARDCYIYTRDKKKYIDLVAGVSSCTLGHCHPEIIKSIETQLHRHAHVMVYGEFIQDSPLKLSQQLSQYLHRNLSCVYLVNSGTEAIEGAIKLAKRKNGRKKVISCLSSYHGSTQGSLSAMGEEFMKSKYRPLIPCHKNIRYNNIDDLDILDNKVAAIIIEPIQGGTNFVCANKEWLLQIRKRCDEHNIELIYDEIQTGFGRTGHMFAYEIHNIIPDILCLAKGMGGGMPIGAFISSKKNMDLLSSNPPLGHITTFGGHPISCAAAMTTFKILKNSSLIRQVSEKRKLFLKNLKHPKIKKIHGYGLMIAIEFENEIICQKIVKEALKRGVITFYFLFNRTNIRISPPLIIKNKDIIKSCRVIKESIDYCYEK